MKSCPLPLLWGILLGTCFPVELCAQVDQNAPRASSVDETDQFTTQVLLSDLDHPVGIALRLTQAKRGPYELFFAERGAGRVMRVVTNELDEVDEVIVDFPRAESNQPAGNLAGPSQLLFLDGKKLIVAFRRTTDDSNQLAGFLLRSDNAPISASQPDHIVEPLKYRIARETKGPQYAGLASSDKTVFIATRAADSPGWVLKAGIEANRLANLQPFIEPGKVAGYGASGGIALIPPPRPGFLVVAFHGSRDMSSDSQLGFFVPATGELAMLLPTSLRDIVSLAYSPSGQLYAADFGVPEEQPGGVYRIDDARIDGRQTSRAVKISDLAHPMGLAFAPDGSLYATALGESASADGGTLVKITGQL